ncbi:MAG: magnesium-translocating P-type ATPase [Thermacetogeniaceae bacterium]
MAYFKTGEPFWSMGAAEVMERLQASSDGLAAAEAAKRAAAYGPNLLRPTKKKGVLLELLGQFKSPLIILLLFAAGLSYFLGEATDTGIILVIVFFSGLLSFWQEHHATSAMAKLLDMVQARTNVLREGHPVDILLEEVVPGDVVLLAGGGVIPADCLLLEHKDLFVDEAALTGESYPVEKEAGVLPADTPLARRLNALFMGTHVISGTGKAIVVQTGKTTAFGQISESLQAKPSETEFERGIRHFGYLLLEVTLILVIAVFAINVYFHRPVLDSFLFSLALAVGLTPQLLPAIISVNLAQGARQMATKKVIVKRLAAIEDFGSMDVLCSDKTGTLTEGLVQLNSALGVDGQEWDKVALFAYLNAFFQVGYQNPIDGALTAQPRNVSDFEKLDEIPYDFIRKRLSILVAQAGRQLLITKGAFDQVLSVCSNVEFPDGTVRPLADLETQVRALYTEQSKAGFRTLGVAYKDFSSGRIIKKEDETEMTFLGVLLLFDPPKSDAIAAIQELNHLGVNLKMITGDSQFTALHVWRQIGLPAPRVLTGAELRQISSAALPLRAAETEIFAEVEPNQKERLILAIRQAGHVVGFMGDGINDGPALHAADVGISVNTAVDVAKEAASIVLLEKGLDVLAAGVHEGRRTFANTLKYVFMATSANFGNMFSMAGASLFLPFLPLLPTQILLTNLLTDLPEMTIASDAVDRELVERPQRWNIGFIRRFMVTFGLLSSIFDYLTFGVLLLGLHATTNQFRTGWFLESVVSASLIVLVVRTRHLFYRSRPGIYLGIATGVVILLTLLLPYGPLAQIFEFTHLPPLFLAALVVILVLYVAGAEAAKKLFYRRLHML